MATPFTYTNRKGRTYYLREVKTKTGKTRYVFSKSPGKGTLDAIPDGYEVAETLNSVLSLVKAGTSPIRSDELQTVVAELRRHKRLERYAAEIRGDAILVCEPIGGMDVLEGRALGLTRAFVQKLWAKAQYSALLRFRLEDAEQRLFTVDRMCFRGGMEGWTELHGCDALRELAREYVLHLGKPTFFELM